MTDRLPAEVSIREMAAMTGRDITAALLRRAADRAERMAAVAPRLRTWATRLDGRIVAAQLSTRLVRTGPG